MTKSKMLIIHFRPTKEIELKEVNTVDDKAVIEKDLKEPQFDATCVYDMKTVSSGPGRLLNRFRKPKKCLIYVEGKEFCEKPDPRAFTEPITDKDRLDFVKKQVLKTLGRFQLMKPWMFIGLLIPIIIVLVLQIIIMRGGRIG